MHTVLLLTTLAWLCYLGAWLLLDFSLRNRLQVSSPAAFGALPHRYPVFKCAVAWTFVAGCLHNRFLYLPLLAAIYVYVP